MKLTPCLCLNLRTGVQLVATASILIGIGIAALSSWILHKALQNQKNHEHSSKELLEQFTPFFGGTSSRHGPAQLYNVDVVFRILISASVSALVGGGVQFLASLALLLAAVKGGAGGRLLAKVWVFLHVFVMLAVGGAGLCLLTNELSDINTAVRTFVIGAGIDSVLLVYFMVVVFSFNFESDYADEKGSYAHPSNLYENKQLNGLHGQQNNGNNPYTTTTTLNVNVPKNHMINLKEVKLRPISSPASSVV